jgi:hypothetical protein
MDIPTAVLASYDQIISIFNERSAKTFVWPDEERITETKYEVTVGRESITVEPIWVDITTANMLMVIHDALRPDLQKRMEKWIAMSRAHFAKIVEFGWNHVSLGSNTRN